MEKPTGKIIIFDGVCNLCNHSVDYIIKHDPKSKFSFTASQQPAGRQILKEMGVENIEDVHTVYLYDNGKLYNRSTAVLRALRYLGGIPSLLYIGIIVPRVIRDGVYDFIAKRRYKWYGKREHCRLPRPEDMSRFLDV